MALQNTLPASMTGPFEIDIPNAYARINTIFISRERIQVQVFWYKTKPDPAASPQPLPLAERGYVMASYDPADPRPMKQALYDWLKTLPDFQNSTDV